MEHQRRKADGNQDAQLVNRHHHTGQAVLQRLVVAQPGPACSKAGQADEAQLLLRHRLQRVLLALDKNDQPRHDQHHAGANGGAQVGLHAVDADLSQDRGQRRKHSGKDCIQQPAFLLLLLAGNGLFFDHQKGARADQHHRRPLDPGDRLAQEDQRQHDGQDSAGLVNGHDLVDVSQLQRPKIAQPRGAGGKPGEDQEDPGLCAESGNGRGRVDDPDHDPGKDQHHDRPYRRGRVRVRFLYAALGQHRCQSRKQRRPE